MTPMRTTASVLMLALSAAAAEPTAKFHSEPKPLAADAVTEDWPQFLGPRRNLISKEAPLLKTIPPDGPKLVWELETGTGYSSPVIADGRMFYVHRWENEEVVLALDPESGERIWRFAYPTTFSDRYGYNNGPRASAAADGDRVYTYGAQGKLHCLRASDGKVLWKRDLAAEYKVPQDFFGTATTPLVEGEKLIVNVGAPGGPTVVALDKMSGKTLWGAGEEWGPSYASPVAADAHGKRRVFVFAGGESRPPTGGLLSINPDNGEVDFAYPWRSRSYESVNASTPIVFDDKVLISATYRTGAALLAVQPDMKAGPLWTSDDFDLHWTTAIRTDGMLCAFAGRNEPDAGLVCVDEKTGKTLWREVFEWTETIEIQGVERKIYESPFRGSIANVGGRFLALGEHGYLMWLKLTREGGEILSKGKLFLARETWNPPVVSRGLLYVTQNTRGADGSPPRLLCYDLRGE